MPYLEASVDERLSLTSTYYHGARNGPEKDLPEPELTRILD